MKKLLLLLCSFALAGETVAQVFSSGDISGFSVESFNHDSSSCASFLMVNYNLSIQNSYTGDVVEMKDEATGLVLYSETNNTGANPWYVSIPGININPYVPDYVLTGGVAVFGGPPVKFICGPDTVYGVLGNYVFPVPDACIYGNISGKVYIDYNNDCAFNGSDVPVVGAQVLATATLNSPTIGATTNGYNSGTNGEYFLQIQESWMTHYDVYIPPNLLFIFPASACNPGTFQFTTLPQANIDFALQCTNNVDVQCYSGAPMSVRPLIPFALQPYVSNTGCDTASGVLQLILDNRVTYNAALSSNPATSVNGDTLFWNYSNLNSLSNGAYWNSFFAGVHLTPVGTVNIGDTLCFSISSTAPAADVNTGNNSYSFCIPVVNSFDPNEKEVTPKGIGPQGFIPASSQEMTYTIHFQNTGNAPALNISITDTLDSDLLPSSFRILGASHSCTPQWIAPNVIRFDFYNINLPDSNANEAMSHGYVRYSIEHAAVLSPGTTIENTAYIYFDSNAPIVTNTVLNTIESPAGVAEQYADEPVVFYPNPGKGWLHAISNDHAWNHITVYNVLGAVVFESDLEVNSNPFDLTHLNDGMYIVKCSGPGRTPFSKPVMIQKEK